MAIDSIGFAEKMHADVQSGVISTHGYAKAQRKLAGWMYPDLDADKALAKLFTTAAGKVFERPVRSPLSLQANYVKALSEGSVTLTADNVVAKRVMPVETELGERLTKLVKKYAEENGLTETAAWGEVHLIPGAAGAMATERAERLSKAADERNGQPYESYAMRDEDSGDSELNGMADAHMAAHNKEHPRSKITFEQAHTHVALNDPRGAKLFRQSKMRALAKNATA